MDDKTAIKILNDEVKSLREYYLFNEILLDRFAAKAMQGKMTIPMTEKESKLIPKAVYDIAEEMMKERDKRMK